MFVGKGGNFNFLGVIQFLHGYFIYVCVLIMIKGKLTIGEILIIPTVKTMNA